MKNNYFNVIIPTRNRLETLRHALKTVLNQDYDPYKIIVSDNDSHDGTRVFVENLKSEKIEYYNTGRSVSMSSNYEFALSKIQQGFVLLIGDDDGLLPSALKNINALINQENILAVSSRTALYFWPGGSPYQDVLMIPKGKRNIERRDAPQFLRKVIGGDLNYSELPMLYTGGVVHSSLIEKAKDKGGRFYRSMTPDVYSGIAIASVVNEYIRTETPYAISGLSKYSTGQSQLGVSQNETIAKRFFIENDIPFFSELGDGKVKSVHFLTLEAYLQSAFLRPQETVDRILQFEIVVAKAPRHLKTEMRDYLLNQCSFNPRFLSKSWFRMGALRIIFFIQDLFRLFKKMIEWDIVVVKDKIGNVYEASEYIENRDHRLIQSISDKLFFLKSRSFPILKGKGRRL